jgi:hypothetical protein
MSVVTHFLPTATLHCTFLIDPSHSLLQTPLQTAAFQKLWQLSHTAAHAKHPNAAQILALLPTAISTSHYFIFLSSKRCTMLPGYLQ